MKRSSTFIHLIYSPMTGVGLKNGYRGDDWFRERIGIFKDFTVKSLQNQTNKQFIHWISFRREEYKNPLVKELADYLDSIKYNFVFTFDGLIYHDDKFGLKHVPLNLARVVRGWWRSKKVSPKEAIEVFRDKNSNLAERLQSSLNQIKEALTGKVEVVNGIFLTRIDTDDMLAKGAVAEIQRVEPFSGALTFKKGFIYDKFSGKLAEWDPKTNPPFHTIIFPAEAFFDARKHLAYTKGFKSHEDIVKIFETLRLADGNYCVLTHNPGNHISTNWDHPFRGEEITDGKEAILAQFGIERSK